MQTPDNADSQHAPSRDASESTAREQSAAQQPPEHDEMSAAVVLDGFAVSADPENVVARARLEVLASKFAGRVRQGETPAIREFTTRNRDCADEIRDLFPIVQALEAWKVGKEIECLRNSMPAEFPVHVLGDYRLVRELGRGGMGIVFEAVQLKSRQRFAVKLLPWKFAAELPHWKERFHREAATIAGLSHPNIVQVHSFGKHSGYYYYVMKLVEGLSLDRVLKLARETGCPIEIERAWDTASLERNPLAPDPAVPESLAPEKSGVATKTGATTKTGAATAVFHPHDWEALARLTAQAALAIAHAHDRDVLHNDIKPSNILLDRHGRIFVSDFAIAGNLEDQLSEGDEYGTGTLRYMAPERLQGRCDIRSDVYALGVTLYELATQRPAFESTDRRELMGAILRSRPLRPRRADSAIPRRLESIILQAMAADPGERYPSAAAFAADLMRFANGQFILARRPSWLRRLFSRKRSSTLPATKAR